MKRLILSVVIGLMTGVPLGGLSVMVLKSTLPVVIKSEREADSVTVTHGRINILVHVHISRVCSFTVSRWLWRWEIWDNKRLKVFVPLPEPGVPAAPEGSSELLLSLAIPPGIAPGDWLYGSQIYPHCGGWIPRLFATPVLYNPDVLVKVPQQEATK